MLSILKLLFSAELYNLAAADITVFKSISSIATLLLLGILPDFHSLIKSDASAILFVSTLVFFYEFMSSNISAGNETGIALGVGVKPFILF